MNLRRHKRQLTLFQAKRTLEEVAIDFLGTFQKTTRGKTHLLVITDRYSKLNHTVPMGVTKAWEISQAFLKHWVFVYGPPSTLLSYNGPPFNSKLLQAVCTTIDIKNQFTKAFNPKVNGQAERFNRTIASARRHYVADNQRDWDMYSDAITYEYNTKVHSTTSIAPLDLVLSRSPAALVLEARSPLYRFLFKDAWKIWLEKL